MPKKLYVGNLPFQTTEEELRALFEPHGEVTLANVVTDRVTGRSRGFGFVEMSTDEQAQAAIQALNATTVGSREIVVNVARPPRSGGPGAGQRHG